MMNGESGVPENVAAQDGNDLSAVIHSAAAESDETTSTQEQGGHSLESAATSPTTEVPAEPASHPESEDVAPRAAAEEESATAPRRRVQLNPTVEPHQARPVAMYGTESSAASVEEVPAPAEPAEAPGPESAPMPAVAATPVELPPADASLDQSLEAEINAAMAGAMQAAPTVSGAPASTLPPLPDTEDQLEPGTRLKAKVQSITAEDVFCEVGYRCPGVVPLRQFPQGKQPRVGEEFLVHVEKYDPDAGVIRVNLPKASRKVRGGWDELSVGQVVECVVNKTNKGGLEVTVSNLRAFLPASQVDLGFVSSLDSYVGQRFPVEITEVNPAKRNLVVSRRAVLIQERKEAAANFWPQAEVGQQYTGRVKTIKDYGAFVDIGGVDGFLHIGEMSWTRLKHPTDVLQEGQQVDVVIISLDREKQKIGLGMRQLSRNPWDRIEERYSVGSQVTGKVTRTADFGAFVELEPSVEGLIHISELDHKRVKKVSDVVNVGDEVTVQVLEVAPDRQRISLSLKATKPRPEEPKEDEAAHGKPPAYERKRKEPLRGGTGNSGPGGLFGNPGDYGR
jgi:small subunit ribosomal protein S1